MALLCFACVLSGFAYFGEGLVREAFFNTKPVTTKREASPVENIIKEVTEKVMRGFSDYFLGKQT